MIIINLNKYKNCYKINKKYKFEKLKLLSWLSLFLSILFSKSCKSISWIFSDFFNNFNERRKFRLSIIQLKSQHIETLFWVIYNSVNDYTLFFIHKTSAFFHNCS